MRPQKILTGNSLKPLLGLALVFAMGTEAFALDFMDALSRRSSIKNSALKRNMVGASDLSLDPYGTALGFLVILESRNKDNPNQFNRCLGAAVTTDVVLTAGHCLRGKTDVTAKFISSLSPLDFEVIKAKSWRINPAVNGGYEGKMYANYKTDEAERYHDIAVIILKSPSQIAVPIPAAPMDFAPEDLEDEMYYYTFGHRRNDIFVPQSGFEFTTFRKAIHNGPARHWYRAIVEAGTLVCEGDSGAPVTIAGEDEYVPGRVIHYLAGIQVTVGGNPSQPGRMDAAVAHWGSSENFPLCGFAITYIDIRSHIEWIREMLAEMDPENPRDIHMFGE